MHSVNKGLCLPSVCHAPGGMLGTLVNHSRAGFVLIKVVLWWGRQISAIMQQMCKTPGVLSGMTRKIKVLLSGY